MNNNFVEIVRKTAGISEEALHEAELIGDESSIRLDEILIRNKLIKINSDIFIIILYII